jgi:hypothetical protein
VVIVEWRMLQDARLTYPPLNASKPVAEGIWIIDGR